MKKTFLKAIKTFFATAALLGLAACNNLSVDSDDVTSPVVPGQKSAVTFNLSAPGRTVFPTIDLTAYTYKVKVDNGEEVAVTVTGGTTSAIEVQLGAHTFTVNGYKNISETQTKVLTGNTTATISALSTELSVVLKGADGSTGTISATLNVGAELGVTAYKVGVGTSLPMAVPDGDATAVSDNKIEYTGSADSGTTQYVVFFLYKGDDLFFPYTFPMYVVAGLTTTATETLTTATFTATVTVTKDSSEWNDSGLELTLVNASDSSDTITMTTTAGTNIYTANAVEGKTYKVYVGGVDKGVTVSKDSTTATLDYTGTAVFPNIGAADAYADTYFEISFDSAPTVNRASTGTVRIYESDGTLVDTIKPAAETMYGYGYGGNSGLGSINVQYQLIQAIGTKVRIIPHHNTTTGLPLLENGKTYYVVVDAGLISVNSVDYKGIGAKEWTFTTGAAPSVSGSTLTVGTDKNFITVQGAFSWLMKNNKTGDWEIKIDKGVYYERIFYSGKANITMSGQTTTTYGTDVEIQWCNQNGSGSDIWNNGSRGRNVFYYAGGNLVLKNITLRNTASRKTNSYGEYSSSGTDTASGKNQAETLMFDSTGTLAAYNASFASRQDTLLLQSGKAWFYKCHIEGDVDYIWGSATAALFEECEIVSLLDEKDAYITETRVGKVGASTVGKGYVFLNSTIEGNGGTNTALLSRLASGNAKASPTKTDYDQVAFINNTFDTSARIGTNLWKATDDYYPRFIAKDSDGNIHVGWKTYGNTGITAVTEEYAGEITAPLYSMEYNGRYAILNRVYNAVLSAYATDSSVWDLSSLETAFSAATDASKNNAFTEPDYSLSTTIKWDFASIASGTQIQGKTGTILASLGTGTLYVDATSGKLATRGTDAQFNSGTKAYIPASVGDTVTVSLHDNNYKLAGTKATAAITEITVAAGDLVTYSSDSCVLLEATGNTYLNSITVEPGSTSEVVIPDGSTVDDTDTNKNSSVITVKLGETPTGYAGVGYAQAYADTTYTTATVTTRGELVNAAKAGNKFIIVDGMIDMSNGMLPSVGGGSTAALDSFVNTTSSGKYATYLAWQEAYAKACTLTTNDKSKGSANSALYADLWVLSDAYKKIIQLNVASNTTIVGKDANSGIKGANISISGVENVVLRNLIIQDAYDPFPHHEKNDGYNAQWDCITIQGNSKYVWIDHCTIQDTLTLAHVYTNGNKDDSKYKEKWQTYDGLLDIKGLSQNMTVSNCKFKNHDKTSLIGNDDSEGNDADKRLITYHHNYFYNCGQRLPMMRNGTFHLYNNYYAYSNGPYAQGYAMGVRAGSTVYAENNYFATGIYAAFSADTDSIGTLHAKGNELETGVKEFNKGATKTDETKFSELTNPAYEYDTTTIPVANVPTNAGTATATIKDKSETIIVDGGGTTGEGITAIAETTTITFGEAGNYGSITKLDKSSASIRDNGGNECQISGTLAFDVKSGAEITISSHDGYTNYTLSDGTTTSETQTGTSYSYTATSDCTITIDCGSNNYFYSIAIVYPILISSDAFFDLRTLFNTLPTTGTSASGETEGLTYSSMYYKDSQHGAFFYNGSTVSFNVSGACTIYLGKDQYNGKTFTVSDGTNSNELDAKASTTLGTDVTSDMSGDSENPSFSYIGDAPATITISVTGGSGTNYLPAIQVKF